ncbi:MAG: glycosyltransferase family 4 protein [Deltaproteobacteria bacterium]|nr:glycosyltransferase family 4 protein [Deltaproteobacteria bacterium]MBW1952727.1 glycosyltransferase family 4 protein [Deltaproteobacteria bacterium]MBW1986360.1 glycosyltransferase family 4 protein [Deltaproteobacteria bacterium]MBW2133753.1 glycosyltransferase family 4 protein [Deltaproteobacteria bacterium]
MSHPRHTYTILHTESSRGWGGQERRILSEAEVMRERGHRLIIGADPRGELWQRSRRAGFAVVNLDFGGFNNLKAVWALRQVCRSAVVDILNTHSSLDSWIGLLSTANLRGPANHQRPRLVRTRHLTTPIQGTWPTRLLYQAPEAVITTGQAIKELIVSRARVPAERVYPVPTGVRLTEFHPRPVEARPLLPQTWPSEAYIIGVVAVLRSWKGHLYLLEALKRLATAEEPAYLLIIGDGPYREVIRDRIQSLGLTERVWMTGHQEQVADWLARMDVVVLSSYANEGVPQALLQAMAMARPVIGTSCGGIPEIITSGVNGLLVPPRDPEALAQALQSLRRNPEQARAFGRQGLALVQDHFSLSHMAEAVEAIYDRVLSRPNP